RLALTETSYATQASRANEANAPPRPVFIELYSDMQETQWLPLLQRQPELGDATLSLRSVGQFTPNVALASPRVNPVRPIAGQSATVSVEVANYSREDVQPTIALTHGEHTANQTLRLPAN